MVALTAPRIKSDPPLAWNDIEALPIYAALILGLGFLWFAITDQSPSLQAATIKAVGIVGCLALRHAWLKLDDEAAPTS
ncbi:hypothetical protein PQ455_06745 [Sphingomonas naphthae]|uniref:Uncharacterized protein n=1 Tax=Sphingomonas naphthae TaxID=1813468 RepID=A0ABY7TPP9_9SPHN|nr:hypothetical protein [Sphingomonas naphthae]WCT74910.1 hypothetical protein PQ455_06745 [Sphingomonas naphthae]